MERNNGKVIAIVALVVAVIGLSLGFAAFSTQLSIGTAANVNAGASNNWNVGFSTDGQGIVNTSNAASGTVNGNNNNGSLTVTKYTLSQATNATLNFSSTTSVSYNLYIRNSGTATAYLDKVDFSGMSFTCANVSGSSSSWIEGSSNAGTIGSNGNTTTVDATDCATLFSATLTVGTGNDAVTYSSTQSGITDIEIAGGDAIPVTLTLAYNSSDTNAQAIAASLDGDITVTAGTIVVDFKSTSN